ncbi:GMP synthase family protein [Candidatus Methanoperedens nitroreducens]|uniref:GMP synthase family protein n=1 Tax=Candidatus Methanoperedens nitratireducens TaxID=1392998 RepID=A0A062VAZ5_9EURY|nr:type 1 glutamine amidotransferase [Candidatus Methanoperedens nitroreducens]KCZ73688.1 GMP synthase family protein [Candidatus Methanoperedens nitroreducens]MDJ1422353.1 type 1 glutamine amidotransferase [Candidatus Methanoperedens sp.]
MRLHSLEHEPFEGLANIEVWARNRGHSITRTLLYKNEGLPQMSDVDWLIIMGGSMNIYEEDRYPWLAEEKKFIAEAIASKKFVLGVCLGSQLIADVLGGKVSKNRYREIGWFPVSLTEEAGNSHVFNTLPGKFTAFHWHGDTFKIPPGAARIAESEGCANQAFEYNGRVIGLQFHLEYSVNSIDLMFENCSDELVDEKYIQRPDEIVSQYSNVARTQSILDLLLDNIERNFYMS